MAPKRAPLLVVSAVALELAPLARRLGLAADGGLLRGSRHGMEIVAAAAGIGPRRARAATAELLAAHQPGSVLTIGVAGALRPGLAVGAAIVPEDLVEASTGRRVRPSLPVRSRGVLLTVEHAAMTPEAKAALRREHGADAVDMESAAIAAVCEEAGVGWACVRTISDDTETSLPAGLAGVTTEDGRARPGALVAWLLRRPGEIPQLLRLGRATRLATRALGEHVAELVTALAV